MHYTTDSSNGRLNVKISQECELAALLECQKCKKFIAWSGDFGMDQYVSWGVSKEEMNLDTIWERFKDFCKPQSNKVRAWFDLLTSFCQGNKNINEWYNAVQAKIYLAKYPPKQQKYYIDTYSGSSYAMRIELLQKEALI